MTSSFGLQQFRHPSYLLANFLITDICRLRVVAVIKGQSENDSSDSGSFDLAAGGNDVLDNIVTKVARAGGATGAEGGDGGKTPNNLFS